MKRLRTWLLLLPLAQPFGPAGDSLAGDAAGGELPAHVFEMDEVEGVVTEARCYFTTGAHGDRHKFCAFVSLKSDLPVGLRTEDGRFVYLVLEPKALAAHVEATLRVKGHFLPGTPFFRPERLWVKDDSDWRLIGMKD
jgi:hypothetical protein